jgi:uncharacterized damage-inducible protein DinB
MNADAIRQFYNYHFGMNRYIWTAFIVPVSQEKFIQHSDYSMGSVRNHIVHMMSCDETWFSQLRNIEIPEPLNPEKFEDKEAIRAYWDKLEQDMRAYLANLKDEDLFQKPFEGEDAILSVWQVLVHVVNHGTDHRAQVLRLLNDLGVNTGPQDFVFYLYDAAST